jgi:hypothetical protein
MGRNADACIGSIRRLSAPFNDLTLAPGHATRRAIPWTLRALWVRSPGDGAK